MHILPQMSHEMREIMNEIGPYVIAAASMHPRTDDPDDRESNFPLIATEAVQLLLETREKVAEELNAQRDFQKSRK